MKKESDSKLSELESLSEEGGDGALIFRTIGKILQEPPSEKGNLVGDCHILKGAVTLIGGEPGCGKSLVAMNLAIAGALRSDRRRKGVEWMGMKVNRPFTTMVVQFENGTLRLYREAIEYPEFDYGEKIFVSNPPRFGERFDDVNFIKKIKAATKIIRPDVVVIDPWTSISDGDYREAVVKVIGDIRKVFGCDENSPALVIVSHTAKPKGATAKGVAMLHDIAGSFALAAHARAVFILERAKKEPESDLVRCTCAKNNNGELGPVKLWHRRAGAFIESEEKVVVESDEKKQKKGGGTEEKYAKACSLIVDVLSSSEDRTLPRQEIVEIVSQHNYGKKDFCAKMVKRLDEEGKIERFKDGKREMLKALPSSDGVN